MNELNNLPESIRRFTEGKPYDANDLGKSGSSVRIYNKFVLKVEQERPKFAKMVEVMQWLYDHKPEPDPVFAHGDFCLPNVFFEDGKVSGFIDLGDAGIADRWYDIALGYRSLKHNVDGHYGKVYEGVDPDELFTKLGLEPNWEKIRYYILLDELF